MPVSKADLETENKDLQDAVDEAVEILDKAYHPEASREELAKAVGDALDALQEQEEDEEEGGDEEEGDED